MDDILSRAVHRQATAYRILEKFEILATWREIGTPVVVGAVKTGLVVQRDIDLITYVDVPDVAACFERISSLAVKPGVDIVFFENRLNQPFAGLYVEFGFHTGDEDWVIENTIFSRSCSHARYPEETSTVLVRVLDDEQRRRILTIKEEKQRRFGHEYEHKRGAYSIDIYRAVFDGGATTYDQCTDWIKAHPLPGVYRWVPGTS
jgi:hypothetical protein